MNRKILWSFALLVILALILYVLYPLLVGSDTTQPEVTHVPDVTPDFKTFTRYQKLREEMVAETIEARGVEDTAVLDAMRSVPRHEFVLEEYLDYAYDDHPLSIGYGQTKRTNS